MKNTTIKAIEGGMLVIGGLILGVILNEIGWRFSENWFGALGVGVGTIWALARLEGLRLNLKEIKKNSLKIGGECRQKKDKDEEEHERAMDQWVRRMKSEFKKAQWGSVIQARKMQEIERWIEGVQEASKAIIILSKRKGFDAIVESNLHDFFMRMHLELYHAALDSQKVRAHDEYEISRNAASRLIQFNKRVDQYIENLESMKERYYDLEKLILTQDGVEAMEHWIEAQKDRVQQEREAMIKLDREIKEKNEKMESIELSLRQRVEARIKKDLEKEG